LGLRFREGPHGSSGHKSANGRGLPVADEYEYVSTVGFLHHFDRGDVGADDPVYPPINSGWDMCGSVMGELRAGQQAIVWFWKRKVEVIDERKEVGA
jgi:hypothetical protein